MAPDNELEPTPMWMVVVGWIFTLLPAAGLIASGVMKLTHFKPPEGSPNPDIGWPENVVAFLAIVEIGCAFLYLFPYTAVLGAILLTGYLGGAVAAHVRIGDFEHFFYPIIPGVLVWLGLFFREARVRALVPIRNFSSECGSVGVFKAIGFGFLGIIVALLGVVAVAISVAAMQPPEFSISRSATFDAPPSKVFEQVNDFHKWDAWSPWLKEDPAAKVTIEGAPGKDSTYKWSGNDKVGEGMMTLTESKPDELVKIKLQFIRPFEDTAEGEFTFKSKDGKTTVTWTMTGQRDLKGNTIGLIMDPIIASKFDEGLAYMKKVVEKK